MMTCTVQVDGNLVTWQKWHLRIGFNFKEASAVVKPACEAWSRLFQSSISRRKSCAMKRQTLQNPAEMHGMVQGLVLHDVCYGDAGKLRPILHRASLVEMIVPVRCWSDSWMMWLCEHRGFDQ